MAKQNAARGFTLVELMVTIAIISVLTTVAVTEYRKATLTEYDAEAYATLDDFYKQLQRLVNDWGIADDTAGDAYRLPRNCVTGEWFGSGTIPDRDGTFGLEIPKEKHHWAYQICVDKFGGAGATDTDVGFTISAHRTVAGGQRVIVMGSNLPAPISGYSTDFANAYTEGMTVDKWKSKLDGLTTP